MINIDFVRKLMAEQDMSQKALAVSMRMTESCVSRMLNGKRNGSLEVFEALVIAFPDVNPLLFLKLDGKPAKSRKQPKGD